MARKTIFLLALGFLLAGCARNLAEQAVSGDEGVRQAALKKLEDAGLSVRRDVAPLLAQRLSSDNGNVRRRAVQALSRLGRDAVNPLVKTLSAPNPKARAAAAEALGQLGADAKIAAEPLVQAEQDGDPDARLWAAVALERIKATMSPAELGLFRALYGGKEAAPRVSVKAEAVSGDDPRGLLQGLRGANPAARTGTVLALVERGPLVVPQLLNALTDPDEAVRDGAAEALRLLTQDRSDADEALVSFLKDGDAAGRAAWDKAFKGLDRSAPASVPALSTLTAHAAPAVRLEAVRSLGALGPAARAAVPALQAAADDVHPAVRQAAVRALGRVRRPEPDEAQKVLAGKLAALWSQMAARLAAGDVDGALSFFAAGRRDDYRAVFLSLGDALPGAAKALDARLSFRDAVGDRLLILQGGALIEGVQQALQPEFVRDDKGDWKIRGF